MILKINEAFKNLGFTPSRKFRFDYDYHLVRKFEHGKHVIKFSVDDNYSDIKYVFDIYLEIYFDEIDKITQWGNQKLQILSKIPSDFELDFLNIPPVYFTFDFILNTYTNEPQSNKLKINDNQSLEWLLQLYEYELKDFFDKYSNIEEAKRSLMHPKSFYQKNVPHWDGCILNLLFAAQNSKVEFLNQVSIVEETYENSNDEFIFNLPKELLSQYILKLKNIFKY